jgi:transcription elongation GreA/GreB family factor
LYFLGPARGGLDVDCEGKTVTVITPASPLGRQMVGKKLGDTVTLPGSKGPVAHVIDAVE